MFVLLWYVVMAGFGGIVIWYVGLSVFVLVCMMLCGCLYVYAFLGSLFVRGLYSNFCFCSCVRGVIYIYIYIYFFFVWVSCGVRRF